MKFPTNIRRRGNKILIRGYKDGKYFKEEVNYKPYIFIPSEEETDYKTIFGENVAKLDFSSIKDCAEYIKTYDELEGHTIYGLRDWEYLYYYNNYPENFEYDFSLLNIISLDIETDSSSGFPNVELADKEITAITLVNRGKSITFGYFDFPSEEKKLYVKCKDEKELLERFIRIWNTRAWLPDIITGWWVEGFDIPYIINRIKRLLGERSAEKLSPFGFLYEKLVRWRNSNQEFKSYDIGGISTIDYMGAYLKFAKNSRESYALDFIANHELNEQKLDYSEYGSLDNFYKQNPQQYYEYNIRDSLLVEKLEAKLHYIQQMVSVAYIQRVNFDQTIKTVKPWDIMIHNKLMDEKIVIPPLKRSTDSLSIMGGYVCNPDKGMYDWVCSIDFTSLYPSLAIQYNISPDTFVTLYENKPNEKEIMYGDISKYTQRLKEKNCCMTTNGAIFKRNKRGFFPEILQKYFDGRKVFKNKMKELKKQLKEHPELENEYHKYDNLQTGYKLIGNSGYGVFLNSWFRWFSRALGEGITSSGQMTTKYICQMLDNHLNSYFKTTDVKYVIYWDTDSAYIHMNQAVKNSGLIDKKEIMNMLVEVMKKEVVSYVNMICKELGEKLNAYEITTSVKLEKICPRVIWTGAKHYVMNVMYSEEVVYDPPEMDAVGMETVKSTVPKVARKALERAFNIIMNENQKVLFDFVDEYKEEFKKYTFEEIASSCSVNTLNKNYIKGVPIYARAARLYNKLLEDHNLTKKYPKILEHDKIKYLYLKVPNPYGENIIAIKNELPKELDLYPYIDYNLQYEKVFVNPLLNVTDAVGWTIEEEITFEDEFG